MKRSGSVTIPGGLAAARSLTVGALWGCSCDAWCGAKAGPEAKDCPHRRGLGPEDPKSATALRICHADQGRGPRARTVLTDEALHGRPRNRASPRKDASPPRPRIVLTQQRCPAALAIKACWPRPMAGSLTLLRQGERNLPTGLSHTLLFSRYALFPTLDFVAQVCSNERRSGRRCLGAPRLFVVLTGLCG